MTVRRQHGRRVTLTLPADFVETYVDLGYAVTAYRAEGLTVDTAHVSWHHAPPANTCMSR